MTDTIKLAKEAGAMFDHMTWVERDLAPVFERFAALVRAEVEAEWIETNKALANEIIELKKAEPLKQEPMFFGLTEDHTWLSITESHFNKLKQEARMKCYLAPVDAKTIRAEALEEAAKVCESKEIPFDIELWHNSTKKEMTAHTAVALAAAIRGLND